MKTRHRGEAGETLVEIVLSLVVMSLVVAAMYASFATASTGSKNHRDLVTADAVLRNSAEATKAAVRKSCANHGSTYSATYSAPAGFTPPTDIVNQACPPTTGSGQTPTVLLTVTLPSGSQKKLSISVITP